MERRYVLVATLAVLGLVNSAMAETFGTGANQFTIDFVTISGGTNPTSGYGIVNNDYRMGVYEVTNDQWNKFKAELGVPVTGDPSRAYNESPYFTGTNVPTNEVSWYEAAQFVNWLNTFTGHQAGYRFTGTQGTSGYALATWSTAEADGTNLYRHKDAFYFLPTEDEWVKAAYWNGTSLQTYANASEGDLVAGLPDPAKWNYFPSVGNEPWAVGSGSKELNGTYDMTGNVWEWMENPYTANDYGTASYRGLRGGAYNNDYRNLVSSYLIYCYPHFEREPFGFRVASVAEPAALSALIDIKPGSDPNSINLKAKGVLPVGILGTEDFDVQDVDVTSLVLAGSSPKQKGNSGKLGAYEDLNGDSILDLILHFPVPDLVTEPEAEELTLTGMLLDGTEITGSDVVRLLHPMNGDANLDGKVSIADLSVMAGNWNQTGMDWAEADFNGDGKVSIGDLSMLGGNWGAIDAVSIPEPATLSLLALCGLAAVRRRKR